VVSKRKEAKRETVFRKTGTPTTSTNKATRRSVDRESSVELTSFEESIALAEGAGNKHLMLGNGFSIALRPDIFTYRTLFDRAQDSEKLSEELAKVFHALGTTDFERVMEALENAAVLVSLYEDKTPDLAKWLRRDAKRLRNVLAETIAEHHPTRPYDIKPEQYASCKRFLANFDGCIYTLNYDLLLYWTLMQSEIQPEVESDDGFRDAQEREQEYVVWDVQNTNKQRVYYLHGALHIYDAGAELKKFTWSKTEIALVDQIKQSLAKREYPLIVTEGASSQKLDRIQHSGFLNRGYRSFAGIGGCLFIYGHSLAENDEHLLKLIDKGKTKRIFVGIFGDPASETNQKVIARAKQFSDRRRKGADAEVYFFDAQSAHIWDDTGGTKKPRPR
jgi:hypothetical protein